MCQLVELGFIDFILGTIHILRERIFRIFEPPSPLRQHVLTMAVAIHTVILPDQTLKNWGLSNFAL